MKKILNKTRLIRYSLLAACLSVVIFFAMMRKFTAVNIIDTLTITGVCFLTAGFVLTVRYVHFNDERYNTGKKILRMLRKKTREETGTDENYDFLQNNKHEVDFVEAYLISGTLLIISYIWAISIK